MSEPSSNRLGRYRRRIIGWGALLLVLAFVIPAFVALRWVRSDLENRVGAELSDAGLDAVSVSFSGQDGVLTCPSVLTDPSSAVAVAESVDGVRTVRLDESCTDPAGGTSTGSGDDTDGDGSSDSTAGADESSGDAAGDTVPATDASDATTDSAASTTASTAVAGSTSTAVDRETIGDVVAADPQFSQLAVLLERAELSSTLSGSGPFTLLAPTDAAFDAAFEAVGADSFNALTSDPERLRTVLLHHVTEGSIALGDFVAGPLQMLDDTSVTVDPTDPERVVFTSGDTVATASEPTGLDIGAANGFLHAVDQLLLPVGISLSTPTDVATTSATLEDGRLTLTGRVATDDQRASLVEAASAQLEATNVVDELTVDPSAPTDPADVERLTTLVGAMEANLVSGTATLTGDVLTLTGVHRGDEAEAALVALGADVSADVSLEPRPVADATSAEQLQDELNEFVRADPITFEPNQAVLTGEAPAVLEQVAARAQAVDGVEILVVGHTDSDGDAGGNQLLSQQRAGTVVLALAENGVDPETLDFEGRGSSEPVLDEAGAEDKAASRRVEFVVRAVT